jgi:integrase
MSFRVEGSKFWHISYKDHTGKTRRVSSGLLKKGEADILERNYRNNYAYNRHGLVDPTVNFKMTFGELIDWWWDGWGQHLQSTTLKGSVEKHLRPHFGHRKLADVTAFAFQTYLNGIRNEYEGRTLNSLRDIARRMFNLATKARKFFGPNPMLDVEPYPTNDGIPDYLEFDEVGPFLAGLTGQYRLVCAAALMTAMRLGELYGLRKQDINWKAMEIVVRHSWGHETTKARKDLVIPIIPDLVPYLRAAVDSSDSMLVFPNEKGGMHTENININERIATALKRAGLVVGYRRTCRKCKTSTESSSDALTRCETCGRKHWVTPIPRPITIHLLRHTTGTLLSKAGVTIQMIQNILGHADIKVTERHYVHRNTKDRRQAMEQNLVFENLPKPEVDAVFTISSQATVLGKEEGREAVGFPSDIAAF